MSARSGPAAPRRLTGRTGPGIPARGPVPGSATATVTGTPSHRSGRSPPEPDPDIVIGDGGFGTIQARIPKPGGEIIITRYPLRELLGKLGELTTNRTEVNGG